ncbi:MAG: helix-turn-helix domain-containing protein [Akkermansiaceae bacterium]
MIRKNLCESGALQPFVACMQRRGIDAERYLEQQRIPPSQVDAGEGKIIKRQAWRLFQEVQRREGLDTLGFLDGDPFSVGDLGALGSLLRQSATLQDTIGTFSQLIPNFAEGNTVWFERGSDISWLCCRTDGLNSEDRVPDHFTIVVLSSVIRMVAGPDWRPEKLRFQSAVTRAIDKTSLVADLECEFGQPGSAVAFKTELLGTSIDRRVGLFDQLGSPPMDKGSGRSVSETLQLVLSPHITHSRLPSSSEAAEILGISRSTLSRTLMNEGSSYQKIVDRVCFEAARVLIKGDYSIKEIANELGYSGSNNFVRAFKRISGFTPSEFRKRNATL